MVELRRRPTTQTLSWNDFSGANYGYVLELYEKYLRDPNSVDAMMQSYFTVLGRPLPIENDGAKPAAAPRFEGEFNTVGAENADLRSVAAAVKLARNFRSFGHLGANINPLSTQQASPAVLQIENYGIDEADLKRISAQYIWQDDPGNMKTAYDVIERLRELYVGDLAYDFGHVNDDKERDWLNRYVESGAVKEPLDTDEQRSLWYRLIEVEEFERFLQRTFVGQKRFSIEGLDTLIPMLDWLIERAVNRHARYISLGMAHRGRLNVLAHILRKPYETIFSEFHTSPNKELVPSEGSTGINYGWTGDVKYHLGAHRTVDEGDPLEARLMLANNPSHLEVVNPVVVGAARAAQDDRTHPGTPQTDSTAAMAILIHGDTAFPGEGVVPETLNMSRLPGYQVGGVIHIIANNQLGFTAEAVESRSTMYASDLAKGFEIPIVHVSADNPEACIAAIVMAHAYREAFHKDFLIDLIGYRRHGHNEMDDPVATQPLLYGQIESHETVRALYQKKLVAAGTVADGEVTEAAERVLQRLQQAYKRVQSGDVKQEAPQLPQIHLEETVETGVDAKVLDHLNDELVQWPKEFQVYPKLQRIFERQHKAFMNDGTVDWATGEALAFASILRDGTPIRLTGQDTERGTFGHRHLVLHAHDTGERYIRLANLSTNQASFDVHNSPLSETGPMGFEYGYDVQAKRTLVIWEAQFGDFANVAQPIIDQFISSGRAKWGQGSGLVLLLPHGYEGQGPEHSSARLERFLQLSAENNWIVANPTSAAQYFHLLRAQAKRLSTEPCPLIVMTPKSLLRNPRAASRREVLSNGHFQKVLSEGENEANTEQVERIILCSGKVGVDLQTELQKSDGTDPTPVVFRLEQLYPFPKTILQDKLKQYAKCKEVVWVQEEPKNMGAWSYVSKELRSLLAPHQSLHYVGRAMHASPAEGLADVHQATQNQLVQTALTGELSESVTEIL